MIEPGQSDILNSLAGRIAAAHSDEDTNLADIKQEFIDEAVRACGNGTIHIPSREVIAAEIWWRHVDSRAKTLGQRVIRDFLKGQTRLCFESDFHRMVRVAKGRRTALAIYNDRDLVLQAAESASNRAMVDASDDDFQSKLLAGVQKLQRYGDLQGVHDAGLIEFIDESVAAS